MEKKEAREAKTKKRLMKYIPGASSALSFQNLHFSPGRDAKNRAHAAAQNRGFTGPLTSLVPVKVRGNKNDKAKNKEPINGGYGFDSEVDEPRSPKVSCIGQIKQRKKLHQLNKEKSNKAEEVKRSEHKRVDKGSKRNPNLSLANIFRRKQYPRTADITAAMVVAPPPTLSQMKMFSSGRDAFVDFDWAKQDRECYSDNEERRRDWDEEEDGGGDGKIPYSAPMMIGGGEYYGVDDVIVLEPRKEICLWKKRNMTAPKPLKLQCG